MVRLGIATLFLFILGGISIAFMAFNGVRLDRQSKEATELMLTSICTSWDIEKMKEHESPFMAKTASDQDLKRYFDWFSQKLGPLKSISSSKGDSKVFYNLSNFSKNTSAHYLCTTTFEKASATINVDLVYIDGHWLINKLDIRSNVLGPP